jgi:dTDP-4-dehydrorhamnose 3,5-epimerase
MTEPGLPTDCAQDNFFIHKRMCFTASHYQVNELPGKLVRVAYGAVLDIAVDLRRSSSTYDKHATVELSVALCDCRIDSDFLIQLKPSG